MRMSSGARVRRVFCRALAKSCSSWMASSGKNCAAMAPSAAGSAERSRSIVVRVRLAQTGAIWRRMPEASLSRKMCMRKWARFPGNQARTVSARAWAACGLCAPSSTITGFLQTISNRPGQRTRESAVCTASSGICQPASRSASTAVRMRTKFFS